MCGGKAKTRDTIPNVTRNGLQKLFPNERFVTVSCWLPIAEWYHKWRYHSSMLVPQMKHFHSFSTYTEWYHWSASPLDPIILGAGLRNLLSHDSEEIPMLHLQQAKPCCQWLLGSATAVIEHDQSHDWTNIIHIWEEQADYRWSSSSENLFIGKNRERRQISSSATILDLVWFTVPILHPILTFSETMK